jgi:hypothetical protein
MNWNSALGMTRFFIIPPTVDWQNILANTYPKVKVAKQVSFRKRRVSHNATNNLVFRLVPSRRHHIFANDGWRGLLMDGYNLPLDEFCMSCSSLFDDPMISIESLDSMNIWDFDIFIYRSGKLVRRKRYIDETMMKCSRKLSGLVRRGFDAEQEIGQPYPCERSASTIKDILAFYGWTAPLLDAPTWEVISTTLD